MKVRAPRNRTLVCTDDETASLRQRLLVLSGHAGLDEVANHVVHQDMFDAAPLLPAACVDLLVLDPPYNLTKDFNGHSFKSRSADDYRQWFRSVIVALRPALKPNATVYVCADWKTSGLVQPVLEEWFEVRNRITWERDKGRGAKANWKNNTEDIWFCTCGDEHTFNVDAVKVKRKVIAPYRRDDGAPKDWVRETDGDFRLTHPSNIWTDITIPFWSMPENTDHPTQKPEKLFAKLVLASSNEGDVVLDPFLGSGTAAVVARKLGRRFIGIERDLDYCCWALKRLDAAGLDPTIQGYADGVFWERNSSPPPAAGAAHAQRELFG